MTCKSYFANLSTLLRLYPQLVFLYRPNADPIISQLALAGPGLLCSAVSPFLELFCPKFCPEIIGQLPRLLGLSREGIPSASTKASGDILPCCYYSGCTSHLRPSKSYFDVAVDLLVWWRGCGNLSCDKEVRFGHALADAVHCYVHQAY